LLELGQTLHREEIEALVSEHLPGAKVHFCNNSVLMFYASDGCLGH
jgi:hypothetical protein